MKASQKECMLSGTRETCKTFSGYAHTPIMVFYSIAFQKTLVFSKKQFYKVLSCFKGQRAIFDFRVFYHDFSFFESFYKDVLRHNP